MSRITPESYVERLKIAEIFGREADLEVDLGCGDGSFLVARAETKPDRNFLGIERMPGRVETAVGKIRRLQLTNVRLLQLESSYVVRYLIPAGSVTMFHLLFPDPWPKRRHWARRVVNEGFLDDIRAALRDGGWFRLVTDDAAYFEAITAALSATSGFVPELTKGPFPSTTFEERFLTTGTAIHRLLLRKVSPSR